MAEARQNTATDAVMILMWVTFSTNYSSIVQLTDGGLPLTPELLSGSAGPPLGAAPGWALNLGLTRASTNAAAHSTPVASKDHAEAKLQTKVKSASALRDEMFRTAPE